MPIDVHVELRALPSQLPEGITAISLRLDLAQLTLHLTNEKTGHRTAFSEHISATPGPCPWNWESAGIPLDGALIGPWAALFRPTTAGVKLEPGRYRCTVSLKRPKGPEPSWRGSNAEWNELRLWSGTVETGVCGFDIVEETPKTITFQIPTKLRLEHTSGWAGGPEELMVIYRPADAKSVTVPIRNGHMVGTTVHSRRGISVSGASPRSPVPTIIDQFYTYKGGGIEHTYRIEVFETCLPVEHFWAPRACGYTVLWKGEFPVSWTAEEVESIRRKHETPAGK